jgi:hypothetical protein
MAAINSPEIVKSRIKKAVQPDGFKDAEMVLKHTNFIREEAGQQINITNQQLTVAKGLPQFADLMDQVTSIDRTEPPLKQLPPAKCIPQESMKAE